jgi:hypothetical protein
MHFAARTTLNPLQSAQTPEGHSVARLSLTVDYMAVVNSGVAWHSAG